MKRFLTLLIVLLFTGIPLPASQVNAVPVTQDGGTTIGEPFSLLSEPLGPPKLLFNGCERVDVPIVHDDFEQQVVELANKHRLEHFLQPLKRYVELSYAARFHAADMAADDYFNHNSMDWVDGQLVQVCTPDVRMGHFITNWRRLGENIAAGHETPEIVMNAWIKSPGHHANIVNDGFYEIGVGYYTNSIDRPYWVQDFATRRDIFPMIINREAAVTTSQQVSLYIYGKGYWDEIRLRNDTGAWAAWQPFQETLIWALPSNDGPHTVTVEMRDAGQTAAGFSASDSITLEADPGSGGEVALGNLPAEVIFLYGQASGVFSKPYAVLYPVNTASTQSAVWTITKSGFESDWLTLTAASGLTQYDFTKAAPSSTSSILNVLGEHTGTLTVTAASSNPLNPAPSTATVTVRLFVFEDLPKSYLPQLIR